MLFRGRTFFVAVVDVAFKAATYHFVSAPFESKTTVWHMKHCPVDTMLHWEQFGHCLKFMLLSSRYCLCGRIHLGT